MKPSQSYILVLDPDSDSLCLLESMLTRLQCPIVVTASIDHAVEQASKSLPYLIILSGNQQDWSEALVNQLRIHDNTCSTTIVALTDSHTPKWTRQEENPGIDGFLVKPLNTEVLFSLVQSAWARRTYCYP